VRAPKSNRRPRPVAESRRSSRSAEAVAGPADLEEPRRLQKCLLDQIVEAARLCREIEEQLRQCPAPELDTILRLYRMLLLTLSAQVQARPELLQLVNALLKPVMDWARIEEQRLDRELARQKHRDQMALRQENREKARPDSGKALSDSTREIIERELKLF
jgi:hypothetical protein